MSGLPARTFSAQQAPRSPVGGVRSLLLRGHGGVDAGEAPAIASNVSVKCVSLAEHQEFSEQMSNQHLISDPSRRWPMAWA